MRAEDLEQYNEHFPTWAKMIRSEVRSVCLLSGDMPQDSILRHIFPTATIHNLRREHWDLDIPGPSDFDLIVGMNVFMYSPDPDLWFMNVLAKCRYLWLQDPVCGKRGLVELGDGPSGDGDAARYGFEPLLRPRAPAPQGYDLAKYQDRLVRLVAYPLNVPVDVPYGLSMMAFLRGDL